ncbi:hypothetical protein BDZ45DRAFT_699985 [Acephala macrosclerotiorum]|nr:hypothetical protein BDZ45DRAFT_699985 [Acephala macrosclerotiorum]
MGNVYETAQRVLVWLGLGGVTSDLEIAILKDFEKVIGEDNATQDAFVKNVYDHLKGITCREKLFSDLYLRSWFWRLWTVQEVALAREALVICGKSSISWSLLLLAISPLSRFERADGRFEAFSSFEHILGGRQQAINALSSDENLPVSTLFTRGLFYRAQVRKDHVFGMYALLQKLGAHLPEPDYGRPVDQIFAEAARLAVESDNTLYILSFVNRLEERENWPSWVPTWKEKLGSFALDERWFKAAIGSLRLPLYTFSDESRRLTVKAKKVDVVALKADRSPLLGDAYETPDDAVASIESSINAVKAFHEWIVVMHTWRLFGHITPSPYGDGEGQALAFAQALMQDCTSMPESMKKFSEILMGFWPWQQLLSAMNPGSSTPMAAIETMLGPEDAVSAELPENKRHLVQTPEWKVHSVIEKNPGASLFDHHVTLACKCKVFFITASGYFGVAPASIRQGDAIVLVSGFQTPLVVRPVEGDGTACILLGPAYVRGMMKGELWPQAERDLSDLTFV